MAYDDERLRAGGPESPGGFAPPAGAQPAQRTSGKAIGSLVSGIVGLIVAGVILGVVAIVLGVVAKREIAADATLSGDGLATAGIVLGAIGFVLAVVILVAVGPTVFG